MTQTIMPAPVRKTIRVAAPPARAFDVFTVGMGRWWSREHTINKVPRADVVVEPRPGGRWFERGTDGSECDWGHVLAWEPPRRLLLAWQLDATWTFNPAFVTELEIRFTPDGDGTRVDLEHRNLERFGDAAAKTRDSLDSLGGWGGLLAAFGVEMEG